MRCCRIDGDVRYDARQGIALRRIEETFTIGLDHVFAGGKVLKNKTALRVRCGAYACAGVAGRGQRNLDTADGVRGAGGNDRALESTRVLRDKKQPYREQQREHRLLRHHARKRVPVAESENDQGGGSRDPPFHVA